MLIQYSLAVERILVTTAQIHFASGPNLLSCVSLARFSPWTLRVAFRPEADGSSLPSLGAEALQAGPGFHQRAIGSRSGAIDCRRCPHTAAGLGIEWHERVTEGRTH
jgi:hypothetical protein